MMGAKWHEMRNNSVIVVHHFMKSVDQEECDVKSLDIFFLYEMKSGWPWPWPWGA